MALEMTSDTLDHLTFLREAIALADGAVAHGNHPFGAVLVKGGAIVLRAENSVYSGKDATNHAEMNLVRLANSAFSRDELGSCTLYTSTEPCAMCTGAIYWSGIRQIVFACSEERLTEIVGSGLNIQTRKVLANASDPVSVIGPLLQEEADLAHQRYWPQHS